MAKRFALAKAHKSGLFFTCIDGGVTIGDHCLIASFVSIFGGNHSLDPEQPAGYADMSKMVYQSVKIGRMCWIGEKAIILPGISIGEKSVVGAGAVVTKNIPPYSIVVGNPAKVIKRYNLEKRIWEKAE